MAITSANLLAPTGALTVELLLPLVTLVSGATTAAQVATAYATVGNTKVSAWADADRADRGAIAWAHFRALSDRAQQILSGEMSASAADEGSVSYSPSQAVELQKQAARWLAAYEAEAADEALPAVERPIASRVVGATFTW